MKTKQMIDNWKEIEFSNHQYFEILGSGIDEFNGEKEYLSTESIAGNKIAKIECKITYENRPARANMQPILNSVWFAKMAATLKVYSFTKENESEIKKFILSTGFAGIKHNQDISSEYIKFYFKTKRFNEEKDKLCTGSTQKAINNNFISKIKIPLPFKDGKPDLKEQERIVKILEKVENNLKKSENSERLLDEYLNSVFNEIFGDLSRKTSWDFITLEEMSSDIIDCPHSTPSYVDNVTNFPCIRTTELKNGYIDWTKMKYLDEESYSKRVERLIPKSGDIVYGREGSFGEAIIIPKNVKMCLGQRVMMFRPNPKRCNSIFLWALLRSQTIYKQALKKSSGSTVGHINIKDIKKFTASCPPLPLQEKFEKIVLHIEKLKENITKSKQNSEELYNSLMNKGFRGELYNG